MSDLTVTSDIDTFMQSLDAEDARQNLGLELGVDVMAYSGELAKVGTYSGTTMVSSTLDLESIAGDCISVGANGNTITAITLGAGHHKVVNFSDVTTLVHGPHLVLPGDTDISVQAGDWGLFMSTYPGDATCVFYQQYNMPPANMVQANANLTNNRIVRGAVLGRRIKSTGWAIDDNDQASVTVDGTSETGLAITASGSGGVAVSASASGAGVAASANASASGGVAVRAVQGHASAIALQIQNVSNLKANLSFAGTVDRNWIIPDAADTFVGKATIDTLSNKSLTGVTVSTAASSGIVGEHVSSLVASGSAVSLTTATSANVTSISLTAGDWDVEGNINYTGTSATVTAKKGGLSSTTATLPTDGTEVHSGLQTTTLTATDGVSLPRKRIGLSSTTTVYLVAQATFSAGTVSAFGAISARRVR